MTREEYGKLLAEIGGDPVGFPSRQERGEAEREVFARQNREFHVCMDITATAAAARQRTHQLRTPFGAWMLGGNPHMAHRYFFAPGSLVRGTNLTGSVRFVVEVPSGCFSMSSRYCES